ncbi:MAG: sugar ABC transporter ATP-binding protein [Eubacteriales bacterium]|nr:sugar ABC transporter ATP-binding protein [Eubacteriales bacterium]
MNNITLRAEKVSMEFPGVRALIDVDFEAKTGEVHAVVGANGAGKSTLMKVLSGANPGYTGELYLDDSKIELRDPLSAKKLGIQIVFQEVDTALIPTLSVAENVMLNAMIMEKSSPLINWKKVEQSAADVLKRLNININVKTLVQDLSLAEKQMILIARAIQSECTFLILDEPTAPLSDTETEELFNLVKHLIKTENIGILFISHRIDEILQICDKYTVMRNGKIIDTCNITSETTVKEIVDKMLGKSFETFKLNENSNIGETVFEVKDLYDVDGMVNGIDLHVRKGEIVGIAGLVGAGKTELCKTIFGANKKKSGQIILNGKELHINDPSEAVNEGIALVPEERRKEGVLVNEDVAFNLSAASLDQFCVASFMNKSAINKNAKRFVDELKIVTPGIKQYVKNLSGGNQQKVAVGKWLAAQCKLYIFDEPTKGVDIGAKQEIYKLIKEITNQGNAVIYATCENSEILSLTDRVYVLFDGKVQAELKTNDTYNEEIMTYAVGHNAQ